jgi:hypothetical protein
MAATKTWTVQVFIEEERGRTRAEAVLRTGDDTSLRGTGGARRNPSDPEVPEIGDELATSRALADLAHQLLEAAASDVEAAVGGPVELRL